MKWRAEIEIKNLEYYFALKNTLIFVSDLMHRGFQIINEAKEKNIEIYGAKGRRSKKCTWITVDRKSVV